MKHVALAIIIVCGLYLIWDMYGEHYAQKMGWKNKMKFTSRMKWLRYLMNEDKKAIDKAFKGKQQHIKIKQQ